jgi:ATP-binding protein involved in chromosome partitioning
MAPTRDDVLAALGCIALPNGGDLVSADLVRALDISPAGAVRFVIEAAPEIAPRLAPVRDAAEAAVARLDGVTAVSVVLTADRPAPATKEPVRIGRHPTPAGGGPQAIPGIARLIPVGSGKGGVGKSTVAANLAVALARTGLRVGLLDADIYGPSQPRMMGVSKRPASPDGQTIEPLHAHGVTLMSIGLMLKEDEPVIWRGPMLMGALQQLLGQVAWGELDALLIDLPPGTGDIQLTLCQRYRVTGAIVVSTPQDIALLDASKAIGAFERLNTPILGLIENMSAYVCPSCGHEAHLFGRGGVRAEAARRGVPFLGEIPLSLEIRESGDAGQPIAAGTGPMAEAYAALAARLVGDVFNATGTAPAQTP